MKRLRVVGTHLDCIMAVFTSDFKRRCAMTLAQDLTRCASRCDTVSYGNNITQGNGDKCRNDIYQPSCLGTVENAVSRPRSRYSNTHAHRKCNVNFSQSNCSILVVAWWFSNQIAGSAPKAAPPSFLQQSCTQIARSKTLLFTNAMIRIATLVLIAFGLSTYLPVSEREQTGDFFNNAIFSTDSSRRCSRMGSTADPLLQPLVLDLLLQLVLQALRLLLRFFLVV